MRYQIEGGDLCIRIPVDAIAENVKTQAADAALPLTVLNSSALAMALGRELCECEDVGGEFYLRRTLDAALERVIESADPSLEIADL